MRDSYWLFGSHLRILAGAAETGGRYDLVEGRFAAGLETPPHRHSAYSEHVYVLEGSFTVRLIGREVVLRAGDDLVIPAGEPHAVAAPDGPARGLVVASPSGFARLVAGAGEPDDGGGPPDGPPDMERFFRISAEIGDEILGPPGTPLGPG